MSEHQPPHIPALDVGAAAVIIASVVGWLPSIAALLGITWYCILIHDRFFKKKK